METIEADRVKLEWKKWLYDPKDLRSLDEVIDGIPYVDTEPVRYSAWVRPCFNRYGHPCHHCFRCGFKASQKDKNYCPNCGAKMIGSVESAQRDKTERYCAS